MNEDVEVYRGCAPPFPELSGRREIDLPRDHPLSSTTFTCVLSLVVLPSGEVARFQILNGPSDPEVVSAIRRNLVSWRFTECRGRPKPVAVYLNGTLKHVAR